ncbi:MAG: SidA/IucD/PvdA family monooxygenase [Solirubrobacteraceae bacterium]|nr:SidA/IucD/PvdA family monooxygenase [Solirubrobacteraceae bacterium]
MGSRIVVVGGGPHALAVLAALNERPEPWPESVAVVDPHERWTAAWEDKLGRLLLDRLRSPQVHHPGPRPMQLRDLVEACPAADQLALRRPEDERAPTPAGMRALVDELVAGLGPVEWIVGRAASIELAPTTPVPADDAPPPVIVRLEDGRPLHADLLVLAHNPSIPRIPGWAEPMITSGLARHASTVDLRTETLAGRAVAVVGGGLTAACLALETTRAGGRVTMLSRRPLRARPYDVDASWLGPRRLTEFMAASPAERRSLIDVARDGGTIPPRALSELRAAAADPGSGLVLREAVDVEAELEELLESASDEACGAQTEPSVDAVWLATGFASDVLTDPLVGPLIEASHIPVHGGLPEVTDDLQLPGLPVFVVGPYAALGVGPASRNLSGARPAAAAVARGLARASSAD